MGKKEKQNTAENGSGRVLFEIPEIERAADRYSNLRGTTRTGAPNK